jgi:hypothetical protein
MAQATEQGAERMRRRTDDAARRKLRVCGFGQRCYSDQKSDQNDFMSAHDRLRPFSSPHEAI